MPKPHIAEPKELKPISSRKEPLRRITMLKTRTIARFKVGEQPGPQVWEDFEEGETVDDVSNTLAESLVRAGIAEFTNPKEQQSFMDKEQNRLESGGFINDKEMRQHIADEERRIQEVA